MDASAKTEILRSACAAGFIWQESINSGMRGSPSTFRGSGESFRIYFLETFSHSSVQPRPGRVGVVSPPHARLARCEVARAESLFEPQTPRTRGEGLCSLCWSPGLWSKTRGHCPSCSEALRPSPRPRLRACGLHSKRVRSCSAP